MCPSNERRRYIVTSSLIGRAHMQNDHCHNKTMQSQALYIFYVIHSHYSNMTWSLWRLTSSATTGDWYILLTKPVMRKAFPRIYGIMYMAIAFNNINGSNIRERKLPNISSRYMAWNINLISLANLNPLYILIKLYQVSLAKCCGLI